MRQRRRDLLRGNKKTPRLTVTAERIDIMKLNYECMRKVLLKLEELLELNENLSFKEMTVKEIINIPALSNEFSPEDIAYSIYMLADAELIYYQSEYYKDYNLGNNYHFGKIIASNVKSLTYKGHEFIENIRNDTIWKKVIEKLKPLGGMTIEIISQAAVDTIKSKLNISP